MAPWNDPILDHRRLPGRKGSPMSESVPVLSITLGAGKRRPEGARHSLDGDPVQSLVKVISRLADHADDSRDQWWSPSSFIGAYRSSDRWESAAAAGVDVDYYDKDAHAILPSDLAHRLDQVIASGSLPGNIAHRTPRGLRIIAVFEQPCVDPGIYRDAQRALCATVESALGAAGLLATDGATGLRMDTGASLDRARFYWGARGRPVVVMRSNPQDPAVLASLAPEQTPRPSTHSPQRLRVDLNTLESAKARFNAEHSGDWPKSGGTCPACGHHDCFGRLGDAEDRWACHSSNHGSDSDGVGVEGSACWTGDALDLALHRAGQGPRDLVAFLGARGYLPRSSAEIGGPKRRETVPQSEPPDPASTTCLADVEPEEVSWLWSGRIPFGKVTVIDGDPGLGKSTLTLEIAACLSRGESMPDHDGPKLEVAGTLLLSAEDGIADTLVPRLQSANADLTRIHAFTSLDQLSDVGPIAEAANRVGAKLIVIDPFMAFVPEATNAHNDSHVRRLLLPVSRLAEELGAAFVVVRHLNKNQGADAMYRGGGSIGIVGAARSALLVAKDPQNPEARVIASTKSNLGPPPTSLRFELAKRSPDSLRASIKWLGTSQLQANDLVQPYQAEASGARSAMEDAEGFLVQLLGDGPVDAEEVRVCAKAAGLAWRTVERAKASLGAKSVRSAPKAPWRWVLQAR